MSVPDDDDDVVARCCAICTEPMHAPVRTACCSAELCSRACLRQWLEKTASCPFCRRHVRLSKCLLEDTTATVSDQCLLLREPSAWRPYHELKARLMESSDDAVCAGARALFDTLLVPDKRSKVARDELIAAACHDITRFCTTHSGRMSPQEKDLVVSVVPASCQRYVGDIFDGKVKFVTSKQGRSSASSPRVAVRTTESTARMFACSKCGSWKKARSHTCGLSCLASSVLPPPKPAVAGSSMCGHRVADHANVNVLPNVLPNVSPNVQDKIARGVPRRFACSQCGRPKLARCHPCGKSCASVSVQKTKDEAEAEEDMRTSERKGGQRKQAHRSRVKQSITEKNHEISSSRRRSIRKQNVGDMNDDNTRMRRDSAIVAHIRRCRREFGFDNDTELARALRLTAVPRCRGRDAQE